jgi:hypothetical protein
MISSINTKILNKCGFAFSTDVKNDKVPDRVIWKDEKGKKHQDKVFRLGEKEFKLKY